MNRQSSLIAFQSYTDGYNSKDPKIKLKIDHTYRVADLCEEIARSLGLSDEDLDLAWTCGLLHDIGRFEQIRRYNTFSDADSINHSLLSTILLFGEASVHEEKEFVVSAVDTKEGLIKSYVEDESLYEIIGTAILWHSAYKLPEYLDPRTKTFCEILRDADKIDILRVNIDTPVEEIYNVTSEELYNCSVTPEVLQAFDEHHAVLRSLKKTPIDHLVGHISLTYELVFPKSRELMKKQGYLHQIMGFESKDTLCQKQFVHIREEMNRFLG